MIFALRQPAVLLGLLLGYLVGVALTADVARRLAATRSPRLGRRRQLRSTGSARRRPQGWSTYLDPYGAVGALLAGVGWGVRPPAPTGLRRPGPGPLIASVVVHAGLAAGAFAAYRAVGGSRLLVHVLNLSDLLHGTPELSTQSFAAQVLLGAAAVNLGCGLLSLVPLPPLEMGVLLWSRLPRSPGARRAAYHLLEEAWGVAAVLVLLLLPLAGRLPALLALLDALASPILQRL